MPTNRNLPERRDEQSVIRRAGANLSTVKTLLAESRAEHWFERGMACKEAANWIGADYCLNRFLELNPNAWQGWLIRAYVRCQLGNKEGCMIALLSAEYHKHINDEDIFSTVLSGQEWLIINALISELFESKYSERWGVKFLYDEINERQKIEKLKIKELI